MANLSKFHAVFSSSTLIRLDKDAFEGHLCQTVNNFVKQNKSSQLEIYYVSFSPNKYSSLSNVYINPEYNIISPSSNVLDLGVYMSSNCTSDFHVASVYKRCSNLTGWILRTFNTIETISMWTLFKSLVLSRLDYASQFWSPHLLKAIYLIEKVQCSFTKHITGIKNKPYDERLKLLNLYSVQRR